jgi:hypothetical protein
MLEFVKNVLGFDEIASQLQRCQLIKDKNEADLKKYIGR